MNAYEKIKKKRKEKMKTDEDCFTCLLSCANMLELFNEVLTENKTKL